MDFNDILEFRKNRKKQAENSLKNNNDSSKRKKVDGVITLPISKVDGELYGAMKVRFLPNAPSKIKKKSHDETPWCVMRLQHSFKLNRDPKSKLFVYSDCPKSLNDKENDIYHDCPICEWNSHQFETKDSNDDSKNLANKIYYQYGTGAKKTFYANVIVVESKDHPEWENKVKILKFGKQIKDQLDKVLAGDPDKELPPIRFYDPIGNDDDECEGQTVLIKCVEKDGRANFEDSDIIGKPWSLLDKYSKEECQEFFKQIKPLEDVFLYGHEFDSYEKSLKWLKFVVKKEGFEWSLPDYNRTSDNDLDKNDEESENPSEPISETTSDSNETNSETEPQNESTSESDSGSHDEFFGGF